MKKLLPLNIALGFALLLAAYCDFKQPSIPNWIATGLLLIIAIFAVICIIRMRGDE